MDADPLRVLEGNVRARNICGSCKKYYLFIWAVFLSMAMLHSVSTAQCTSHSLTIISCVDHSLNGSQKVVLRIDGKPFYMTNIQIRLDKLRYYWGWDAAARDAIVARAAADGFNTVSLPIHWYEVEPKKNKFDWTILDEYVGLAQKYHLKMELLWFGQNSGGHVQWLGDPATNPVHLRTPDYVLYSPAPGSSATTSDYTIRRDMSNYTLDLADKRLRARETYVLGRVMEHIASWDAAHGSKHIVVGVQLDNEVRGINHLSFPESLVVSYLSAVGGAVKHSKYVVWTRLNCVYSDTASRIDANKSLRSASGTNIDFVGIDLYGIQASTVRSALPNGSRNYRMITESGADVSNAPQFQLAALAGNNAYDYYDMCGPDGHGLYDRAGAANCTPHGWYIHDVQVVNRLLNSDVTDIAIKAQGSGLFVHNWAGNSTIASKGIDGITFVPRSPISQAISIRRSDTDIVLMNTEGGTFIYPSALGINGASEGYFDYRNQWIDEGSISFTSTSISPPAGVTVRLTRANTKARATK